MLENIARVLFSDEVLKAISGVLRRKVGARVDVDTLEAKIRELCPNLPENIRGFRAPKKKEKPSQPEIKVVTMAKEGANGTNIGLGNMFYGCVNIDNLL